MQRLAGKRVVVTQADAFMGADLVELFRREGAHVIADQRDLRESGTCEALISEAGHIDILMANLACEQPRTTVLTSFAHSIVVAGQEQERRRSCAVANGLWLSFRVPSWC